MSSLRKRNIPKLEDAPNKHRNSDSFNFTNDSKSVNSFQSQGFSAKQRIPEKERDSLIPNDNNPLPIAHSKSKSLISNSPGNRPDIDGNNLTCKDINAVNEESASEKVSPLAPMKDANSFDIENQAKYYEIAKKMFEHSIKPKVNLKHEELEKMKQINELFEKCDKLERERNSLQRQFKIKEFDYYKKIETLKKQLTQEEKVDVKYLEKQNAELENQIANLRIQMKKQEEKQNDEKKSFNMHMTELLSLKEKLIISIKELENIKKDVMTHVEDNNNLSKDKQPSGIEFVHVNNPDLDDIQTRKYMDNSSDTLKIEEDSVPRVPRPLYSASGMLKKSTSQPELEQDKKDESLKKLEEKKSFSVAQLRPRAPAKEDKVFRIRSFTWKEVI